MHTINDSKDFFLISPDAKGVSDTQNVQENMSVPNKTKHSEIFTGVTHHVLMGIPQSTQFTELLGNTVSEREIARE